MALPKSHGQTVKPSIRKRPNEKRGHITPKQKGAIIAALQEATHLPTSVREMLQAGVSDCFATDSPQQRKFVSFIMEALNCVEADLSRRVTDAETAAATVSQATAAATRAHESASAELAASLKEMQARELCIAVALQALEDSKTILANAKQDLCNLDAEIGDAAMASAVLRQKLASESLAGSSSTVETELSAALAAQNQKLNCDALARVTVVAAVKDACAACVAAEAEHEMKRCSFGQASAAWKERASSMKVAWNALREVTEEQARVDAPVAVCRKQLMDFREGALAAVKALAWPAPDASRKSEEAATPYGKAAAKPDAFASRRLSFAEVRRRRSSFVPRKMVECVQEPCVDPSVSVLPTPLRLSR
jgi:hypothetical protein